jgi:B12-binding domain/radical SAM domain protein
LKKRRIVFRVTPFNRLSFPVLLNVWENHQIDNRFEIIVRDRPLTPYNVESLQPIKESDVFLFSFMTPHLPLIHEEIKTIKETGACVCIAGGGPHIAGEQALAFEMGFDTCFVGPGETNFLTFGLDLLENKKGKNKIYQNTHHKTNDINKYFPISTYMNEIPPLEIMRGCFWNCTYCSSGQQNITFRTLDSIKTFLDKMDKRNFNRINYISPSSMEYQALGGRRLNLEKIEELLYLTRSYDFKFIEYGIFPSEIRPDTVSDEGMKILKKYVSHKAITLGAQSGSNARLKELNRGHNVEEIEGAVAIANSNGFLANLDFIVAYPDETPDERQITLQLIKRLNKKYRIRAQFHHFFPLSGSQYTFRFPSFLLPKEKEALRKLKESGICRDGWVENERQAIHYFNWLKENFPLYYSKYH